LNCHSIIISWLVHVVTNQSLWMNPSLIIPHDVTLQAPQQETKVTSISTASIGTIQYSSAELIFINQSFTYEEEACTDIHSVPCYRPPLWSIGQSSWPQIRRSRVRFPGTTRKKSSGSRTGSTQPREYN
jgi:hypothetical protein